MSKIKVSAVNYLNTRPFIDGLEHSDVIQDMTLSQDYPALCAQKLVKGEADIALVPVAVIPFLKNPHIVADYGIGAEGTVKTVCLFSEVPIEEISSIYLDYQSRTSVQLVQILCREYWKIQPELKNANENYISQIKGNTAGVVIGDRAIALLDMPYVYDLAEIWQKHTGLPFLFAAWVSNAPVDESFRKDFNAALESGLNHRANIIHQLSPKYDTALFSTEDYLMKNISYLIDEEKKIALQLFLKKFCAAENIHLPHIQFQETVFI